MSLILDALRKSERTRQQSLTSRVSAADPPPGRARIPVPWATIIGLLLILNVAVLAIVFWRSQAQRTTPAPIAAAANAAASPASVPVYRPAVRSLAAEAAAAGTAPASVQAPAVPGTWSVAGAVTPASPAASGVTAATPPTPTAAVSRPASASVTVSNANNAPLLDTLPLAFQQSLPPLHLDVHSYSVNPANRFVVINMQRYRTGDTLKEGPKVIGIVPDGVVLEYHGQEFLLPRP